MDRIGWGVLATGHIAGTFARDLALLTDEADLIAVGSRNRARAEAFAQEFGFRRAYGSYAELAADPAVDVIYIASPHSDHFSSAKLCLEAGKAVLAEKPLTVTAAETDELVELARDRGVFLMEAMWMRTQPLIRRAAEIVAGGELGAVRHVSASFGFAFRGGPEHRLLDPEQAGGAILDLGVYPVHAVDLFLGQPDTIRATGWSGGTGVDIHAAGLLGYGARGDRPTATADILCSLEVALPTSLEVFCTDGSVIIDDFFIRPARIEVIRGSDRGVEPEVLITQWPGAGYTFQAQEVMRCLRAGELASPLVPWATTQGTMRTLDRWRAAVAASASGT